MGRRRQGKRTQRVFLRTFFYGKLIFLKISTDYKKLVDSYFPVVWKLLLTRTLRQRHAIASAAYVLCRQKPPAPCVKKNSDVASAPSASADEETSHSLQHPTSTTHVRSPLYSDAFCWLFFKDYLIAMKRAPQKKSTQDAKRDDQRT